MISTLTIYVDYRGEQMNTKLISFFKQMDKVFFNTFFRTDFRLEAQKLQRKGMNGLYCFMAILPVILGVILIEKFVNQDIIILELVPVIAGFVIWCYLYRIGIKLSQV
jgi:hypothetical protein